ncbi:MAG TPA: universal stress protein [Anaerolineae bacterium]|nr:universal stress protein [Anaerolineae bacterium]
MATRILVPLDGSELAEQAIPCATMLAGGLPAELVLFRAVAIEPDAQDALGKAGMKAETVLVRLATEAEDYLRSQVLELRAMGLSAQYGFREGPAAESILDYATGAGIDYIVMATHGYSGFKRWTHGSVAERVLQAAQVPLLLVRPGARRAEVSREAALCRRILVPLDGSRLAERILPVVSSVARALDSELILFQVPIAYISSSMTGDWYLPVQGALETAEQDAQAYLDEVAGRLAAEGLAATTALSVGSVAACIVEYAEAHQVDLIAMCTHGRTGLARWALGSVTDRVLRAGTKPLLLVRAN